MVEYNVRYVIICDDARQELSGKEILIGVYNDIIIFNSFPINMDRLFFRISITCPETYAGPFSFAFVSPTKEKLFESTGEMAPSEDPFRLVGLGLRGAPFPVAGKYEIHFGLDEPPKKIWELEARLPEGSVEVERMRHVM